MFDRIRDAAKNYVGFRLSNGAERAARSQTRPTSPRASTSTEAPLVASTDVDSPAVGSPRDSMEVVEAGLATPTKRRLSTSSALSEASDASTVRAPKRASSTPPPVPSECSPLTAALANALRTGSSVRECAANITSVVEAESDKGAALRALGALAVELGKQPVVNRFALNVTTLWTINHLNDLQRDGRVNDESWNPMGTMLTELYFKREIKLNLTLDDLSALARGTVDNHFLQLAAEALESGSVSYSNKHDCEHNANKAFDEAYVDAVVQDTFANFTFRPSSIDDRHRALLMLSKSYMPDYFGPSDALEKTARTALNVAVLTRTGIPEAPPEAPVEDTDSDSEDEEDADAIQSRLDGILDGTYRAQPDVGWYQMGSIFKNAVKYVYENADAFNKLRRSMGLRADDSLAHGFTSQAIYCFNDGHGYKIARYFPPDAAWSASQHGENPINLECCLEIVARIHAAAHKNLYKPGLKVEESVALASHTREDREAGRSIDSISFKENAEHEPTPVAMSAGAAALARSMDGDRFGVAFVKEATQLLSQKSAQERQFSQVMLKPLLAVAGDDAFVAERTLEALRSDYMSNVVPKALETAERRATARELLAGEGLPFNATEREALLEQLSSVNEYDQAGLIDVAEELHGRVPLDTTMLKALASEVRGYGSECREEVVPFVDKLAEVITDPANLGKALRKVLKAYPKEEKCHELVEQARNGTLDLDKRERRRW